MSNYLSSPTYFDYLVANFGVRGHDFDDRSEGVTRPDVDIIIRYSRLIEPRPGDRLLEVGCGIGRILKELHASYGIRPYGIDLIPAVIEGAKERVADVTTDLRVSAAEAIDHPSSSFDEVLCWGTFDLTEQERSLREMARVTRRGGRILLTGKSDRYHADDSEARIAEEKSREKGIPNHYTDYAAMLRLASALGLDTRHQVFFERRGDFSETGGVPKEPEHFYEWLVVFEKVRDADPAVASDVKICDLYSATYRALTAVS